MYRDTETEPRKHDSSPFISFIIPFYNRFNMLKEAVQSVLSSDFKNLEIILVDDASGYTCQKESMEFANKYANIFYIREEKNLGPGAARNRGIQAAKGEWLFFMDSDDIIYGHILPELAEFLKSARCDDVDIVSFNKITYKFADNSVKIINNFDKITDEWWHRVFDWRNSPHNRTELWNFCFRRCFLVKNDIKCDNVHGQEECRLVFTAVCYAKKTAVFLQGFYEYRVRAASSLTATAERKNQIEGRKSVFNSLLLLCEADIPRDKKTHAENLLYRTILYSQWDSYLYRNNKTVYGALDRLRGQIAVYTDNWRKKAYISPCFLEAPAAAKLISNWGGGGRLPVLLTKIKHPRGPEPAKKTAA
ncbi:MAG: glycosyltransferase family 2 protein [Spirochaetaceae bacterium]|jgi:glycosyltransferase involved in cell wall biosynthesis|nr:glycosyltransferase family 2 protein [Spirochaetaceae bacterium]